MDFRFKYDPSDDVMYSPVSNRHNGEKMTNTAEQSSPALSTNSLCYEAVQRTLRNAGVAFLRQHLPDAFPENHLEQLKRPLKNEWEI
jgi:hypothetical protein